MIQKKYFDFKDSLNENVQQAKVYLKNLALKKKKEASGETDQPVGLSADEVRAAETNPNFIKIKDMCRENPGYTYLFTKIFYEEYKEDTDRFEDLQNLYNEIKGLGNLVKELPMPIDRYAAIKPTDEDQRPISERIQDDIEKIKLEKSYKKFYNELLNHQRKWVDEAPKQTKERLRDIGVAFGEMGKDDNGKVDPELQKSLHRVFYSKLKDFKKLDDLVDYALNYVKSVNNNQFSKFIKKIDEVNTKFGPQNGAGVIYDKDGYLVIEVKTYIANRELNGHTSHCIARSQSYWDNYLEDYNKQYYVYNFNLDPTDTKSVIGMTIRPNGDIRAAHDKVDSNVLSTFKSKMKEWNIPFEVFAPMTREEQEIKRKRIEASKKIIEQNLTVEDAVRYLENGADPNAKNGLPLRNAVKANNKDLVKLLLSKGAQPNITESNSTDTAISQAEDLEMVQILVKAGASLNSSIFRKLATDYDAVKYLLEAGLDPNFDRGYPFRKASQNGQVDIMKLLLEYADNIPDEKMSIREKQLLLINERRRMSMKWAADGGKIDSILFILDTLKNLEDESMMKDPEAYTLSLIDYISSSLGLEENKKPILIADIKDWLKRNFGTVKESKRFTSFSDFKY
jgi:ankyrin repeat protein